MEKNMKETFDIKYRPEIESGKYRVVTRRGEPVEILKWDAKGGDFPIVGLVTLIETDAQEPYSFMADGRFDPNAVIDDLDLFVTNEPELTKFEKDLASPRFVKPFSDVIEYFAPNNMSQEEFDSFCKKRRRKMKLILDACCGGKMFYFDKKDQRVLFQDIRSFKDKDIYKGRTFSVEPDIIADFTSMPFPDNSFRMVVFDPPHLKYTSEKETMGWQMQKYGWLPRGRWRDVLTMGFAECFRVLQPGGFLIFKWNETDIPVRDVLELTDQKPVFGHISGKRSNTHWICFMKEEQNNGDTIPNRKP